MKGADPELAVASRDEPGQTVAHLARGLVRESHRDDLVRASAPSVEEVADAVSEDSSLAAACSGKHEQRPVAMLDGASLLGIQPVTHVIHLGPRSSLMEFLATGKAENAKRAASVLATLFGSPNEIAARRRCGFLLRRSRTAPERARRSVAPAGAIPGARDGDSPR
jgi:hypothetical protein